MHNKVKDTIIDVLLYLYAIVTITLRAALVKKNKKPKINIFHNFH